MWKLKIWDAGAEPAFEVEVRDDLHIGRAVDAGHCLLRDANAGRKAARIVLVGDRPHLEDLGSRNATQIRGGVTMVKDQRIPLVAGMVFEIGRSSIQVIGPARAALFDAEGTAAADDFSGATMVAPPSPQQDEEKTNPEQPPPVAPLRDKPSPQARPVAPPAARPDPSTIPAPAPRPAQAAAPKATPAPKSTPPPAPKAAPAPRPAPPPPSPKSAPPPKPQAAPDPEVATSKPVPAKSASVSPKLSSDAFNRPVSSGTMEIKGAQGDQLAVLGALAGARARLVVVNDADRRAIPIESPEFTIGRENADVLINHPGVSAPHATISFILQTMSFQVVDLGSRNQTFLGPLALTPKLAQPLQPESLLRIGPIETVFVVARDSNNEPIPAARYAAALEILVQDRHVSAQQARNATAEAAKGERHAGEVLMLSGALPARAWTRAFELAANYQVRQAPPMRAKTKVGLGVVVLVLALAAAALWWFRASLFGS